MDSAPAFCKNAIVPPVVRRRLPPPKGGALAVNAISPFALARVPSFADLASHDPEDRTGRLPRRRYAKGEAVWHNGRITVLRPQEIRTRIY
jgi:hypothetical protein